MSTADGEARLLRARIDDAVSLSMARNIPKFVGFLNEFEAADAASYAAGQHVRFCMSGGYEGAERMLFAALPDWADEESIVFPITALTVSYRRADRLSHRDFLGTLMSFGITRDSVGDILIEEGRAVLFLHSDILRYVTAQLSKVGGVGVTVTQGAIQPLPVCDGYTEMTGTVASPRLDAVIAALLKVGREKSAELIASGLVFVNQLECLNPSKKLAGGETVTVRHRGKFIIDSVCDTTKKGRVVLRARRRGR